MEALQLDLFSGDRLPRKPYCSDSKGFQRISSREAALKKRYIQPNPPCLLYRFVFDVDRPSAADCWAYLDAPPPNWTATNRENGHAHLGYEVELPVCTSDAGRQAPIRFAAAIEAGLSELLNADVLFAGTLCKNPLHPVWNLGVWADEPYDLHTLGAYIPDLEKQGKKRKSQRRKKLKDAMGLGRNCILFDSGREWAYTAIRDNWGPGGEGKWFESVRSELESLNECFTDPLPLNEVKHIARSISKWTWREMTPTSFRAYVDATHSAEVQAKRGKASGAKRAQKAAQRAAEAQNLRDQGMTQQQIAKKMGASQASVSGWLKKIIN